MIVCRTCGGHNAEGDTFCGSCGEFLEWSGEKLATPSEQAEPAVEPIHEVPEPALTPRPAATPEPLAEPTRVSPASHAGPASVAGPTSTPGPPPAGTGSAVPGPEVAAPASAPPASAPAASAPPASESEPEPEPTSSRAGFTPAAGGFRPAVSGFSSSAPKPAVPGPKAAVPGTTRAGDDAQSTGTTPRSRLADPAQRAAAALVAPPGAGSKPIAPPSRPPASQPGRKPQPQEMRPQTPERKRRPAAPVVPSPPTRQLQPDDLICGMCGEGNPPTRRFCSRCGESLQTATVVPTPWWRKVLQYLQRRRVHSAGARPKRRAGLLTLRGVMSLVRRTLIVAALLAALAYAVFPGMRQGVNEFARASADRIQSIFVPKHVPVRAVGVSASAQLPGHPAGMATDLYPATFWSAPGGNTQPTLIVEFERPANLVSAIVHNGGGEAFQALSRPRDLHLSYFDGNRPLGASDVTLTDTPDEQQIDLEGRDGTTRVEVQVLSFYTSPQSPDMALSYLEFFERQS